MNVGIDKISFFVPPYYVDMTDLALAREVDPNKFHIGIGQDKMAVNKKTQDIVTFAANAAKNILTDEDKKQIDMVIVGTESSIDESKASAVVLHRLLNIQPFARAFEIKEACYAGTAALQYAVSHIQNHPESKVLVVASDIAKYGLASGGEPTQGAGAVAMLVSAEPRILQLNDDSVALTQDIYDFWRPVGHDYPMVDGQLSNETYIQAFQKVWDEYRRRYKKSFADFHALTFHIPYTKMGKKALLAALENEPSEEQERILEQYEASIVYSRQIGNLYTGSLYLGLISLLENGQLNAGDQVGLFSYGSGTVAEFFSGTLVDGYQKELLKDRHQKQLTERKRLSINDYEEMFNDSLDVNVDKEYKDSLLYSIATISNTVRMYKEA
ncbi:hydroxymethylglutaryl-CoA synthase [Enterococcus quebecensis]|uniref:Hydroxymethylglutaryl-CoA synthase n=1 Tax=Enterococcus quebecensis TaxID=903983 RepID=A0A1E5GQS7_9ENTE|nr:hydroxymethylglutaryl-CoA synthase [Enterococcus quebecensis]OEG14925.1 hydroxymethylglutaryl-CoA synthase [Enterococcus quebecensis]OJG74269.1 hydroxymethylglutaryl-CoA synthase [Enterococcus quebecensis]